MLMKNGFELISKRGKGSHAIYQYSGTTIRVNLPTLSAVGKISFNSAIELKFYCFIKLYHWAKAVFVFGYLAANSLRRLRVIMCISKTKKT